MEVRNNKNCSGAALSRTTDDQLNNNRAYKIVIKTNIQLQIAVITKYLLNQRNINCNIKDTHTRLKVCKSCDEAYVFPDRIRRTRVVGHHCHSLQCYKLPLRYDVKITLQ